MNGVDDLVLALLLPVARWLTSPLPFFPTASAGEVLPVVFGAGGLVYVLFNLRDALSDRQFQEDLTHRDAARVEVARAQVRDDQARLITLVCIMGIYAQFLFITGRQPTGVEGAQILIAQATGPLFATAAVAVLSVNSWWRRRSRLKVRRLVRGLSPKATP